MAGIGFELNKLYREKGLASKVKAISYSGFVVAGPIVLGVIFVLVMSLTARFSALRSRTACC